MRYLLGILLSLVLLACGNTVEPETLKPIKSVDIELIYEDSVSIRALDILDDGSVAFAASSGKYGLYNPSTKVWNTAIMKHDSLIPSFRAVAHTAEDFFMLSIESPALLYKTGDSGAMELVYEETDPKAFYDSMIFWDDQEGIAMGDPTDGCISIINTRDGGETWEKVSCDNLPEAAEGEAAFAASNSNITVFENNAWIITGGMKSRVLHTADKGKTWEVYDTPLKQGTPTTGGYSINFYDETLGVIIGGDYTNPKANEANKAMTKDGGKTWELLADKQDPGHRSNIQFIPGSEGQELLTVSHYSIDYSSDQGATWKNLSSQGFFTVRFLNDSTAYAAGNGNIARLTFKR